MGMFDELRCAYPLPAEDANDLTYQTKDTPAQWLDRYEIDKDGNLLREQYDTEDCSGPEATGLSALAGCQTRVNKRIVRVHDFTGEIRFYACPGPGEWIAFSSYFINGKLQSVTLLQDTRRGIKGGQHGTNT